MKITVFSMVVLLISLVSFIFLHEQVHVEIYKSYGIDSYVDYFSGLPARAYTYSEAPCPTEECSLAHNYNEVVGYQLQVLLIMVGVFFVTVICLLELIYYRMDFL